MAVHGEQTVNLAYGLAVIGMKDAGSAPPRSVGILLAGQVDQTLRFGVMVARFPSENGSEAAVRAATELEGSLRMHVEPVLVRGGVEMTLSAPAQALHYALRSSQLSVIAIRPERTAQVRLCDALENAREIARQQLLHAQGVTSEQDSGTWLPLIVDFGPYRIGEAGATSA